MFYGRRMCELFGVVAIRSQIDESRQFIVQKKVESFLVQTKNT